MLESQGITTLQCLLSIRRNIYDGMVSQFRPYRTGTDYEQVILFKKWVHKYAQDNDDQVPTDWVCEYTFESFHDFAASQMLEEESRVQQSLGTYQPPSRRHQGTPNPPEDGEENPLFEPLDTFLDSFIQGGPDSITPTLRPTMDHWDGIQMQVAAKSDIKSYPTFHGTLSKWKLFKDSFIAVATSE